MAEKGKATTKNKAVKDILAWCLVYPDHAIPKVLGRLKPSDLADPDDQATLEAMLNLYSRGECVDLVTLAVELDGKMDQRVDKLVGLIDRPLYPENIFERLLRKLAAACARRIIK